MKKIFIKVALYGSLGGVFAWAGFFASEKPIQYTLAMVIVTVIDLIKG